MFDAFQSGKWDWHILGFIDFIEKQTEKLCCFSSVRFSCSCHKQIASFITANKNVSWRGREQRGERQIFLALKWLSLFPKTEMDFGGNSSETDDIYWGIIDHWKNTDSFQVLFLIIIFVQSSWNSRERLTACEFYLLFFDAKNWFW